MTHRQQAATWAQTILNQPLGHVLILDTETCDLNGEVIELAIINTLGETRYHSRYCPITPIQPGAFRVLGLTAELLAGEACFADEYELVAGLLGAAKQVLIYNAAFDLRCLAETCRLHKRDPLRIQTRCLMQMYAEWYGEPGRYGGYKWQKLMGGDHSALGDARAALNVLRRMAGMDGDA
jgi:DNA polymerase-3 subunit epsilon